MSGSKKISDKNLASFRGCTKPPALQVASLLTLFLRDYYEAIT